MPPDTVEMHTHHVQSPKGNPKNRVPKRIDGRTAEGRRCTELIAMWTEDLGAPTPIVAERVAVAAELTVVAEIGRARFLKGGAGAPTAEDMVRLQRVADQAQRGLGLSDAWAKPAPPDLATYLRGKAAGAPA
jgi:hypothetical protein